VLGRNVVVETAAVVEGCALGEGTVVESFARVGEGAVLGKVSTLRTCSVLLLPLLRCYALYIVLIPISQFCKIVAYACVPAHASIPDYTVVYGAGGARRTDTTTRSSRLVGDIKAVAHGKQLNGLRQLIPSSLAK
jgi:carbonic anhydrase/acetyltransferase-like protein (isoleucine patch superfamily)